MSAYGDGETLMKPIMLAAGLGALTLLTGCETADSLHHATSNHNVMTVRPAKSGRPALLAAFFRMNPDCSAGADPVLSVISGPRHGALSFRDGQGHPDYGASDRRSKCNDRAIRKKAVFYTSRPGFVGEDHVSVVSKGKASPRDTQYVDFTVKVSP